MWVKNWICSTLLLGCPWSIPAQQSPASMAKTAVPPLVNFNGCGPQKQESSFKRPPSPGGIRDASPRARTSFQRDDRLAAGRMVKESDPYEI